MLDRLKQYFYLWYEERTLQFIAEMVANNFLSRSQTKKNVSGEYKDYG